MALTVYTSKDNQWREYVNPLRGLTTVGPPRDGDPRAAVGRVRRGRHGHRRNRVCRLHVGQTAGQDGGHMKKGLEVGLVALAVGLLAGCSAYRGISHYSLVHVRRVSVTEAAGAGTNVVVDVASNGVRVATGRALVIAENVYVSVGGGTAASNDVAGEQSIPLTK